MAGVVKGKGQHRTWDKSASLGRVRGGQYAIMYCRRARAITGMI